MHELISHRDYTAGEPFGFWRSASGYEVDVIIGDHTAIEIKGKESVSGQDLRSLRVLREEGTMRRYICVSLEPRRRKLEGVTVLPYREFLEELWGGAYK